MSNGSRADGPGDAGMVAAAVERIERVSDAATGAAAAVPDVVEVASDRELAGALGAVLDAQAQLAGVADRLYREQQRRAATEASAG